MEWEPLARRQYEQQKAIYDRETDGSKRRKQPVLRMRKGEDRMLLKLASAFKVLMGRSVRKDDLSLAKRWYQEYLVDYVKVRLHLASHSSQIKHLSSPVLWQ
jgi:hypothetical protein